MKIRKLSVTRLRSINKNRRALPRLITDLEQSAIPKKLASLLTKARHQSTIIGITGPAGAGKSTLSSQLVRRLKKPGRKIGFIGCDPSSPFTGGAFLGDRIRLSPLASDRVFIRSMATRGALGGLARATPAACGAIAKAGYDPIIVESVGVGQTDVEIVKLADIVAVVLTPDLSDTIQLSKAGLLEIADLFIINKADHAQVLKCEQNLKSILVLTGQKRNKPIFKTIATHGKGLTKLVQWIEDHI